MTQLRIEGGRVMVEGELSETPTDRAAGVIDAFGSAASPALTGAA